MKKVAILGGGMTGLAAGYASGAPVYEAAPEPGGICSSYYVRPGSTERLAQAPSDGEAYRFEIGGGHWIFGGDPVVLDLIRSFVPVKSYARVSSVFFHDTRRFVPYPLQNNLRFLPPAVAQAALTELVAPRQSFRTMKEWLRASFGPTLCELFFNPFHELYTAGMYERIAPQDAYKSPINLGEVIAGAFDAAKPVGYNTTYIYPEPGLNMLASRLGAGCDVRYGKRAVTIDAKAREVHFADGTSAGYEKLISTLPLHETMAMAEFTVDAEPDPYTSVLVLNIGAVRGPECPADHWLYNAGTASGFHRVGFYSNVDTHFLPRSARAENNRVSIYVERAFPGGKRPSAAEARDYSSAVVSELQRWGFIAEAEVVDPTWIDVAYTWSWPGSRWVPSAMRALQAENIFPVGRYARWTFQGIADSLRDGLFAGPALTGAASRGHT
ncbi:MAG TPA: FAD-dependent oxidoreductase [Pirellulales bacterium]|jgi:protoporphyrinogen oxidase|nr:FAD-dependent oxidoreductase [Pirellulales bacterium]